jgi:hypothetical protein
VSAQKLGQPQPFMLYGCVPAGMRGPTRIFLGQPNTVQFPLQYRLGALGFFQPAGADEGGSQLINLNLMCSLTNDTTLLLPG